MGLFSRKVPPVESRPFWQVPPFPSTDPEVLYQHGITCVSASDGPGMISVGWTLWDLAGLQRYQAWDFISDGFRDWVNAGDAPADTHIAFLNDMLQRLDRQPLLPIDIDLHSLQPGVVEPTAPYYTGRCWAISELLCIHEAMGTLSPQLEGEMLARLEQIHPDFMPARTLSQFNALKHNQGLGG